MQEHGAGPEARVRETRGIHKLTLCHRQRLGHGNAGKQCPDEDLMECRRSLVIDRPAVSEHPLRA